MLPEEKYNTLKKIFWDYNIELLPLNKIVNMQFDEIDKYEFELIINRMLERLSWIDLLDILGVDKLKEILGSGSLNKLRRRDLKERYERIRRILYKESLPLSGWDPEYIKGIKTTLLSNRWYAS
jgi:hypothetical protein